jgi:hypothetical protein
MTWGVVDKAIRESLLPPPSRLVLRTLADQLNPPKDWDHRQGDAWDPRTSQELLVVWCDRETLTHATGYSLASLCRIMRTLVHDYAVLRCLEPARQHYTAHWWFDLEALRGLRDPWFEQRAAARQEARQSRRRRAAREAPPTMSSNGHGAAPRQHETVREPTPTEPSWEREWKRRYDEEMMGHRPREQAGNSTHADGSQGAHAALSEKIQGELTLSPLTMQGAQHRPSQMPEGLCWAPVSPLVFHLLIFHHRRQTTMFHCRESRRRHTATLGRSLRHPPRPQRPRLTVRLPPPRTTGRPLNSRRRCGRWSCAWRRRTTPDK